MQVTVAKSFFKKIDLLKEKAEQEIKNKASDIVSDAVDLSPVDTGAFVESWKELLGPEALLIGQSYPKVVSKLRGKKKNQGC